MIVANRKKHSDSSNSKCRPNAVNDIQREAGRREAYYRKEAVDCRFFIRPKLVRPLEANISQDFVLRYLKVCVFSSKMCTDFH